MIIKDYRIKSFTTEEFLKIFANKNEWSNLSEKITHNEVNVSNVDINKLFSNDLSSLWNNYYYICKTFKKYLEKVNPEIIDKNTFSKLLTLENEDDEYISILKNIVDSTNKFNDMYFYDYEENNIDHEKTKDIIVSKIKDIDRDNLYHCFPNLLFKHNNFNPILITSLNSDNNWEEEDYEKADFRVILI